MPSYNLDTTGLNPSNLVSQEQHTITESNNESYRIIIPTYSPFYIGNSPFESDNFMITQVDLLGNLNVLVEGVDYNVVLPYIGASRSIGKMLYGGISIINNILSGNINISYQTLGGSWVADPAYVITKLSEMLYNPRITIWDVVTNVQTLFPPINHDQSADYIYGYQDLITAVNNLADVIANGPSTSLQIIQHILNTTNPHAVTKAQVGLASVIDIPVASDAEVSARALVDKHVTLRQLVSLLSV